jgi:hypothetical protein
MHESIAPSPSGEGIREVTASVARVLLLQVRGQGRGLQIFHNSLKMDEHSHKGSPIDLCEAFRYAQW